MKEIVKNKKIGIAVIIICVLILAGVIIGLALSNNKDKADRGNAGEDVIVYEADENTVEEVDEDGLVESDSEDGPVLSEDNMIDFNGGDAESGDEQDSTDGDKNKDSNADDDSNKDEGTKDTGSWGAFY